MIDELLRILSRHDLEETEVEEAARYVREAPEDPELDWLADPPSAMAFALYDRLDSFVAQGDTLEEVHDELQQLFDEPLPPFPHEAGCTTDLDYFRWLDDTLKQCTTARGGSAVASLDLGIDDQLRLFAIDRTDCARLRVLADALSIRLRV